jgi:hypothetical protein
MVPKASNESALPDPQPAGSSLRRWKIGAIAFVGVMVLVVAVLRVWIGTPAFFYAHVLPLIGEKLQAETSVTNGLCRIQKGKVVLTAQDGRLGGWTSVWFSHCNIFPVGDDPTVTINELKLTLDSLALIRGSPALRVATLISPVIHILKTNDESNLDQMLAALRATFGATGVKPEFVPREIELRDCSIQIKRYSKGPSGVQEAGSMELSMSFTNRDITPAQINGLLKNGLPPPFNSLFRR